MCATFSRDQYISLHYLNANLRDVFLKYGTRELLTLLSTPVKGLFTKNYKASPRVIKGMKVLRKRGFFFRKKRAKKNHRLPKRMRQLVYIKNLIACMGKKIVSITISFELKFSYLKCADFKAFLTPVKEVS